MYPCLIGLLLACVVGGSDAATVSEWVTLGEEDNATAVCCSQRCPPNNICWPEKQLHSNHLGQPGALFFYRSYCQPDNEALAVCAHHECCPGLMCAATLRVCQDAKLKQLRADLCEFDYVCVTHDDYYEGTTPAMLPATQFF